MKVTKAVDKRKVELERQLNWIKEHNSTFIKLNNVLEDCPPYVTYATDYSTMTITWHSLNGHMDIVDLMREEFDVPMREFDWQSSGGALLFEFQVADELSVDLRFEPPQVTPGTTNACVKVVVGNERHVVNQYSTVCIDGSGEVRDLEGEIVTDELILSQIRG